MGITATTTGTMMAMSTGTAITTTMTTITTGTTTILTMTAGTDITAIIDGTFDSASGSVREAGVTRSTVRGGII